MSPQARVRACECVCVCVHKCMHLDEVYMHTVSYMYYQFFSMRIC